MTNTERNLEKRVWLNGEEAAWLADKIVTGSPEYCNDAARFLRKYSEMEQQLSEANSLIAMQAEVITSAESDLPLLPRLAKNKLAEMSKLTAESVAAWEAEKLLPLQRQVAMLIPYTTHYANCKVRQNPDDIGLYPCSCGLVQAMANTQATAEAYDREHASKVLEEAAKWFYEETEYAPAERCTFERPELILNRMAAEKRATKVKE